MTAAEPQPTSTRRAIGSNGSSADERRDEVAPPLLRVRDLARHYAPRRATLFGPRPPAIRAVDGVSFDLYAGRTLALVGESGCGKSTLARTLLRLEEPTRGSIHFAGEDLLALDRRALRARRRDMQLVFQDPYGSLDPRMRTGESIREPLDVHRVGTRAERDTRVAALLQEVGLPADAAQRYPDAFSGGQRQRIGIARALALSPRLVIADEPVSALDVSVQAQILALLVRLQAERGLAYLFVSHDLAVVRRIAHDVAVMYRGRIVEQAPVTTLFAAPAHPYTQALLAAVPQPDPAAPPPRPLPMEADGGADPAPAGCPFYHRCPVRTERCRQQAPTLQPLPTRPAPSTAADKAPHHLASCHHPLTGGSRMANRAEES